MKTIAVAFGAVVFGCCACSENQPADTPGSASGGVRVFGTVHAAMQGDAKPVVTLAEGLKGGYGLGALSELRGEFVAIPDQVWLAYPTNQAVPELRRGDQSNETAALLVAANVAAFRATTVGADIPNEAVEEQIAALASAAGVDVSQPFPFLIQGRLRALRWHVIDGTLVRAGKPHDESAQKGVLEGAEGTVVGFYSTRHQGVFTMYGQNTHMHVIAAEAGIAGHVDGLEIPAGCTVSFP